MAGITKSDAGVQALRLLATTLNTELENVDKAHDELKQAYDGVKSDVAHEAEIEEILEEIRVIQAGVCVPVATLAQRCNALANKLEAFLHGGLGNAGN